MDSIADDPRFSHIVTDPRFRPMPKAKRKVKIDKRFSSLFSSKHFKARTDIDKRGRPVQDVSKRNKHVMERFYELSSDDSDDVSDENDSDNSGKEHKNRIEDSEQATVEIIDLPVSDKSVKKSKNDKTYKDQEKPMKLLGKKRKLPSSDDTKPKPVKKTRLTAEDDHGAEDSIGSTSSDDDDDETSSDDSENDTSDSDEENLPEYTQDFDMEETTLEHKWNELHTDAVEVSDSTHRLAVCNMDWDFVKAQDLFVLLKSFVPEGGRVRSVTIYPSEFGKERMTEEALLGPKELRDLTKENENGANSTNQETAGPVSGKKKKGKRRKAAPDQKQEKKAEKNNKEYETEKLREYQLNRLRYFYAVVDCDSVETADSIYNECDGKEYQLSSVRLDLRFIPDEMTFDDTPKDSFSEQQGLIDYAPNKFNSSALSQAKVEVTWDETDFDRLSRRIVGLQQKELENMVEDNQYADLIAPPESDSEAESDRPDWLNEALAEEEGSDDEDLTEEKKIQLYRKVLMEKLTEEKQPEDGQVDQEIQWTPGLKSSAQEKLKKKKKGKEMRNDIVEGYLEKKKQKKKKKLDKKKEQTSSTADGEDQLAFSDDELPSDVDEDLRTLMEGEGVTVSSKSKSKKKKEKRKEELADSATERERAELELLMMDDREKSISKPKSVDEGKMSKKKKKKMAKLAKEKKEKEKQEFALDMDDDRFSALFTSHHFHIDPNAPQFKKTQNMMELVNEQISRKKKSKVKAADQVKTSNSEEVPDSKLVSKQLVESLKRKMKK